jgi:hypothetical protein
MMTATGKDRDVKQDNGEDKETVAELADRLGLRDADGKLDLEAAGRVQKGEAEAKAAREKAAKEAEAKAKKDAEDAEKAAKAEADKARK